MADLEVVAVPTTPEGVLCRAADYMDEHGWTRFDYVSEANRVCILGACMAAAGGDPAMIDRGDSELFEAARRRLELHLNDWPPHWNDHECESKEQAVSALRAAAGGCKEAGGG